MSAICVAAHLPYARRCARRWVHQQRRPALLAHLEDFQQEAAAVLLVAARRFNPSRGVGFLHYLAKGIRMYLARAAQRLLGFLYVRREAYVAGVRVEVVGETEAHQQETESIERTATAHHLLQRLLERMAQEPAPSRPRRIPLPPEAVFLHGILTDSAWSALAERWGVSKQAVEARARLGQERVRAWALHTNPVRSCRECGGVVACAPACARQEAA